MPSFLAMRMSLFFIPIVSISSRFWFFERSGLTGVQDRFSEVNVRSQASGRRLPTRVWAMSSEANAGSCASGCKSATSVLEQSSVCSISLRASGRRSPTGVQAICRVVNAESGARGRKSLTCV